VKKTLVLLTLNEIEGITALFDKIPWDVADEVFVVDGGSTDGTREYFSEKGVRLIDQEKKGRGEAFRIAFDRAQGDVLCFFSPDGNEDPSDIPRLFTKIEAGADLAIARRFGKNARNEEDDLKLPLRAWANRSFTLMANLIFNRDTYVQDTINGYRAITRTAFERLGLDAHGFLIEYQMTIRAMKLRLKITEVPTIEAKRIGGESTASSIPTGYRFLRGLLREIIIGRRFNK
jgi:glycosyltransferase involved in cell wall biosynthesis